MLFNHSRAGQIALAIALAVAVIILILVNMGMPFPPIPDWMYWPL